MVASPTVYGKCIQPAGNGFLATTQIQVGRLAADGFEAELNGIHSLVTTVEVQTRVKAFLAPRG